MNCPKLPWPVGISTALAFTLGITTSVLAQGKKPETPPSPSRESAPAKTPTTPIDPSINVSPSGSGWGVIAKAQGIKPGSDEFHELKESGKQPEGKGQEKGKGKGPKNNP